MERPSLEVKSLTLADVDTSMAVLERRLTAFLVALAEDVGREEDSLPVQLARLNAPPRLQLRKVYQVLEKIGSAVASKVASTKG